jgi:hypothetical protein
MVSHTYHYFEFMQKNISIYFAHCLSNFFYINPIVEEEMFHLKTTQYKLNILHLKLYPEEFVLIKSLNTCSLHLHF